MVERITKEQYEQLCSSKLWDSGGYEEFHKVLEQTTGITAKRYVGYMYYDDAGNYIGCNYDTIDDLLYNAYIEIVNT